MGKRQEQREACREEMMALQEEEEEDETEVHPWQTEISTCDNLKSYLEKFLPKESSEVESGFDPTAVMDGAFKGGKFSSRRLRDEEESSSRKGKKGKKRGGSAASGIPSRMCGCRTTSTCS